MITSQWPKHRYFSAPASKVSEQNDRSVSPSFSDRSATVTDSGNCAMTLVCGSRSRDAYTQNPVSRTPLSAPNHVSFGRTTTHRAVFVALFPSDSASESEPSIMWHKGGRWVRLCRPSWGQRYVCYPVLAPPSVCCRSPTRCHKDSGTRLLGGSADPPTFSTPS